MWKPTLLLILALLLPNPSGINAISPRVEPAHTHHIIDDRFFTSDLSFNATAIQNFLEAKGADCEGSLCLKSYQDPTTGRTAAEIIATTAAEIGLNPQVILITLQKENSLVTAKDPQTWQYRTAMGYGCPDGADCAADFFGFSNQIQLGATLLRVGYDRACGDKTSWLGWRVAPRWYRGHVTMIDGRATRLGSCATAALYSYTPHRVDSAWVPALDGNYYYGNYNFVYFYQD
ncbi:MAG: hypothetical protein WD467_02415 [Candidatus Saccharimonadales bacterium]